MAFLKETGVQVRQGSFYTPLDVVEELLALSLVPRLSKMSTPFDILRVLDPACGTGNFLVIAALMMKDRLCEMGLPESEAIDFSVRRGIYGVDIDVNAVTQCRNSLSLLTDGRVSMSEISRNIVCTDSLALDSPNGAVSGQLDLFAADNRSWYDLFPDIFQSDNSGFDLVIGNPPFLNQLETDTSLDVHTANSLQKRFGEAITKMTNPASVFMLVALDLTAKAGEILMIQPLSFLATAHSSAIRKFLASRSHIANIWICFDHIFEASVEVAAVHLKFPKTEDRTCLYFGRKFEIAAETDSTTWDQNTWSMALALAQGFPSVTLDDSQALGQIAVASAAFRDQFYGLVGAVVEEGKVSENSLRLATVGLIDPAVCRWSQTTTRFAKESFEKPVVLLDGLDSGIKQWAESMRGPKLLVATQSRVIECFVDVDGSYLPGVPLVSVRCSADDIWKVGAALSAPPVSLWAVGKYLGGGLSSDVLRLTAKDLIALPLPIIDSKWIEGSILFREAHLTMNDDKRVSLLSEMGAIMCEAYGVSDQAILRWWIGRLPRRTNNT